MFAARLLPEKSPSSDKGSDAMSVMVTFLST
jgi:hypothetical protein